LTPIANPAATAMTAKGVLPPQCHEILASVFTHQVDHSLT
jgi:hypothetical protein